MAKNKAVPKKLILLAFTAVLLLSACTSKIAYRFLDWTVAWSIEDYIDWTSPQQTIFDLALDNTIDWHQSTQLPHYSNFLRHLAQKMQSSFTAQELETEVDQTGIFWQNIMQEITPAAAKLFKLLDAKQTIELLENIEEKNLKRNTKYQRMTAEQRHSKRAKSTIKFAKRFIGSLSKEQKKLVREWASSVEDTQLEWATSRSNWVDSFCNALQTRTEPGFEKKLSRLLVNSDSFWSREYERKYADNKRRAINLYMVLHSSLSKKQQKKLQRELHDWADSFDELSQEIQPYQRER